MDNTKDCQTDMGAYIEAIVDASIKNGQEERAQRYIPLDPSGNLKTPLKCCNLKLGKVVTRRRGKQLHFFQI